MAASGADDKRVKFRNAPRQWHGVTIIFLLLLIALAAARLGSHSGGEDEGVTAVETSPLLSHERSLLFPRRGGQDAKDDVMPILPDLATLVAEVDDHD